MARVAFPAGSLAIRVRDELGVLFRDEAFVGLYSLRGRPGWSPGRLAMVLVLQFAEGLSDRQAAEAVRARIDWKYALALALEDPGFHYSVLSEFRTRPLSGDGGRDLLDGVLAAAGQRGLVVGAGRARTDSTHVLSWARELSFLELVGESLRSALNAVAAAEPHWLRALAPDAWFEHYATRLDQTRFPKARAKRDALGIRIGSDGAILLDALASPDAPAQLRDLPAVQVLRRVWSEHFEVTGQCVRRLSAKERPPVASRVVTPFDLDARGGVKRDLVWDGYKVHLTETCEPDTPHLITNVLTTIATQPDNRMAQAVHTELARRDLVPDEHWVDGGYANANAITTAAREHGIALHGPLQQVTTAQSRAGGAYSQDSFAIDWDQHRVTCPAGAISSRWATQHSQQGLPVIRVMFSATDCRTCPALRNCVSSPTGKARNLTLRPHAEHRALHAARMLQQTPQWKRRYQIRAGVEGTISQAVRGFGIRRSRYKGLAKTSLQHQLTGAAIDLARIDAWLTATPHAPTRIAPLAALRLSAAAV